MSESSSLVLLGVLLTFSAFFSASEVSLVSMTKLAIRRAIERHGERGRRLVAWERHSDRLLTTLLVGNNIVNTAVASIGAVMVTQYVPDPDVAVWVNTAVMTSIILTLGEIIPKQVAKRRPERVALFAIRPVMALNFTLRPLVWMFGGMAQLAARLLGAAKGEPTLISRSDVEAIVEAAGEEGALHREERVLLEEALSFREAKVREIMTPRVHMATVRRDATLADAQRVFAQTAYSRLPVTGRDENEIVGVLFAKDLLLSHEAGDSPTPLVVADLMREHLFVPEMITLARLMDLFRRKHMHIAMVIGEYGDVTGLVTMENVLERLVGQIEDEFDPVETGVKRLTERRYVVKGSARLDDVRRTMGIELPEGEYETVGGYLISELGRIPSPGAALRWDNWLIQVYEADERRVLEVTLLFIGRLGKRHYSRQTEHPRKPMGGSPSASAMS